MSVRTWIPFAGRVLRFVAKALISMSGDAGELELFSGPHYTLKIVKIPHE